MAIIGIALGAGVIVYALSLRTGDERLSSTPASDDGEDEPQPRPRRGQSRAVGFDPAERAASPTQTSTYVPLSVDETPWQRRLAGLVGLIALVAVGAAALAGAIYQVGHILNQTIARFLK